jgi:ethanolaminephosphotransferase
MIPKQSEMDSIVRQIYEAIETHEHLRSTVLVLCGDHGMNEAGNHGGSSAGETSAALLFISPKFKASTSGLECPVNLPHGKFHYYSLVEQVDIVPTLAGLLGFPMPLNNLGIFIPDVLNLWSPGWSGLSRSSGIRPFC